MPGSHVNNLFRISNPAYSLTYLRSSLGICEFINGRDVDWCLNGLTPPSGSSCGGPGFCSEDFIGCPLKDLPRTCNQDNNGDSLPDCSGKSKER